MNRLDILNGAEQAVAQRGENYGSPKENFGRIAKLWTAYIGIELSVEGFDHKSRRICPRRISAADSNVNASPSHGEPIR